MKRMLLALLIVLALVGGCQSAATPEPTAAPSPVDLPATVVILPTPTPVPPPPTPTPVPKPTDTPLPEPTATPEAGEEPTATPEQAEPTATEVPEPSVPDVMVQIPAGPFVMGNDGGPGDESPAHEVDLAAFEIDQFEVSNADFAAFVSATGYETEVEKSGGGSTWQKYAADKDGHPVVKVSWNDAVAYCTWLGKRLPSEAEWEKAAKGSEGYVYPWGSEYDPQKANGKDRGIRSTTAVGSFPEGASPYGVMDMAGNVWEWTADWYEAYPGSSYQSDYFGERFRVLRGGGWFETADFLRTTTRNANTETAASDDIGFRCAR